MALDWCMLGPARDPHGEVSISLNAHVELLYRAGGLPLLACARDYYADAEYAPGEVAGLLVELQGIGPDDGGELATVLPHLKNLCLEALRRGWSVAALAD